MSFAVFLQYLLPKRALTEFAGWCANSTATWWVHNVIPWFIKRYGVNMAEAANPDPRSYATFNAFFTRALKPSSTTHRMPNCFQLGIFFGAPSMGALLRVQVLPQVDQDERSPTA
jgi:hypothetical protein